jgi:hypothetical protein
VQNSHSCDLVGGVLQVILVEVLLHLERGVDAFRRDIAGISDLEEQTVSPRLLIVPSLRRRRCWSIYGQ